MRANYAVLVCLLLMLVPASAQVVNNPAGGQTINEINAAWDKTWNSGNADALAWLYTADAVDMGPNEPALVGKDAIRASCKKYFDQFRDENHSLVQDVRISGNLAVARGTQETKTRAKARGYFFPDKEKWIIAFQRQPGGSWEILWEIYNSDLPLADSLPMGKEELGLVRIERDMAAWSVKNDWAALDKILTAESANNVDGAIATKTPCLANMRSGAFKVASASTGEMKVVTLGETGVVHGLWIEQSTLNGKDTSGTYRYTDNFAQREGRWQRVARHPNTAQ